MELPEEQNKLKEIAAGNVEAFEHLFFQYQPRLVNFLIGLTHDKEVSRDMAQDLFLSLWKDREKLKNVRSFSSYLFQMARFTVYDYFDRLIVSEKYTNEYIIRKSKFPQNPKRSVRFSGKRTKRSVQKRKARNTQKAETKVL